MDITGTQSTDCQLGALAGIESLIGPIVPISGYFIVQLSLFQVIL